MNKSEMADLLEEAADLYESGQVEWCRGMYYRGTGADLSVCSLGSLRLTLVNGDEKKLRVFAGVPTSSEFKRLIEVESLLNRRLESQGAFRETPNQYGVAFWNDKLAQSKQDVIDLFKETAKDLRNEG